MGFTASSGRAVVALAIGGLLSFGMMVAWVGRGGARGATGGWAQDDQALRLYEGVPCNLARVDASSLTVQDFQARFRGRQPVVLTGKPLSKWRAMTAWTKDGLLRRFGDRTIKAGMGSDIVSSGGGLGVPSTTFRRFLSSLNETDSPEQFTFDVDFGKSMPELLSDFKTPKFFTSFNGDASRAERSSWHMLSIGGSRRGLPFHVHGETWLGLIFGQKRWFIFPPGRGLANLTAEGWHPLLDSWTWFREVYPGLSGDDRPMECVQGRGEVLYLPSGWKHLTLNIGETIAVGGQAAYSAEDRLRDRYVQRRKVNPDVGGLHGASLAA
jgi:hypothetical protein